VSSGWKLVTRTFPCRIATTLASGPKGKGDPRVLGESVPDAGAVRTVWSEEDEVGIAPV
jgi:hypothetical protein